MRNAVALLALSTLATGCGAPASPFEGIWVAYWAAVYTSTESSTGSENYLGGKFPEGDEPTTSEWTHTEDIEQSEQMGAFEIVGGPGDMAYLFSGGELVPGTVDGKVATFAWSEFTNSTETDEHESGYKFVERQDTEYTTTITIDRGTMTGTAVTNSHSEVAWSESDEWDATETGQYYSEVPASSYLEQDGTGYPDNEPDAKNCEAADCRLSIEETYAVTRSFRTELTDWDENDRDIVTALE